MYFTLNQAAKETGKSKGTISRYLKNGKLSFIEKNDDGYKIDPAELFRVFPKKQGETRSMEHTETADEHPKVFSYEIENKYLHDKIKMLEEQLVKSEEREQSLSVKLDTAQETLKSQTLLLTDMREKDNSKQRKKFLGIF